MAGGDTHYGPEDGTTAIVWHPNQPTGKRTGDVWVYTWEGWCDKASATSLIPADGTAMSDPPTSSSYPQAADCVLTDVDLKTSDAPNNVEIVLTYTNTDDTKEQPPESGDIEQRSEVISLEFSVDDGAVYDAYPNEVDEAKDDGKTTISIGGLRYQYSEWLDTFTWSEANLVEKLGIGIGQVAAPTGITTPTANKWIFRGAEVNERGGLIQKSETWEYSPIDWPN